MTTVRPALRLTLVLLFALSGLASAHAAWAQFPPGLYRGVEDMTGNTFLFRLELPSLQPVATPLVVGTIFNLEAGTYRVLAGRVDRGGLNIYFSFLCTALNQVAAAQILASPSAAFLTAPSGEVILNPALINQNDCCQVDTAARTGGGDLAYHCGGGHDGILHLLRP